MIPINICSFGVIIIYNYILMCYYIKTLYFNDPLFNETDATYIIHLENNGRYKNIEKELKKYHPTNIVHSLFNKG